MLIKADRRLLGDGTLSAEEALIQSREKTDTMLKPYRMSDQEELKDVRKRLGNPMPYNELIRRVLKLNPSLWAEDSINMPGNVGFYRRKQPKFPGDADKQFLVAFPKTVLPEFSIMETDERNLIVREVRGWRTVLLRLVKAGALSLQQALSAFGDTHVETATRWRREVQPFRN